MVKFPERGLAVVLVAVLAASFTGCGDDSDDKGDSATETDEGVFPLLGTEGDVPQRPALAVKVDNTESGRPQTGLRHADIVYEEVVEGGLTRLLAVYHSQDPEVVAPVRSARSTDISLLRELDRPLFAWSGANPTFTAQVEAADVVDVGMAAVPDAYERDASRTAPYDLDAKPDRLREFGDADGGQPPMLFEYRDEGEDLTGPGVESRPSIDLSGGGLATDIRWEWNEDTSLWERTQDRSPHVDSDGEPITAANVLIRETPYEDTGVRDSVGAPVPEAAVVGEGPLLLLSDGQALPGEWARGSFEHGTAHTDQDGELIQLTPGQTWIEVLPPGSIAG